MKSIQEVNQLLSQRAPSDPLVKLLNETFGPLGWQYDGPLTVMVQVREGHFLSVSRSGLNLAEAAALFGLEVKSEKSESTREGNGGKKPQAGTEPPVAAEVPSRPSRKVVNDSITECSTIILGKKLRTREDLIKMLQVYGATNKVHLTDDQAVSLLEELNAILKETK